MNPYTEPDEIPAEEPITLVSYAAEGWRTEVYLEHAAVGGPLPAMPLFLRPDRYVSVPLEYQTAWRGMPPFWRDVLEHGHE